MADDSVAEFFRREAEAYHTDQHSHPMAPFHVQTARRLERELRGDVLCVGGLWALIDPKRVSCRITVVDLTPAMLERQWIEGARQLVCDCKRLPFAAGSFDHVVFPLVLHHVAGRSGREARENVRLALREARRVLRPGGRLWISEFCTARPIYAVELLLSRFTRRFLERFDVPLVVMHSASFFEGALKDAGFQAARSEPVRAPETSSFDLLQPVMGLPLHVPRIAFPVRATLITAAVGS